MAGANCFRLFRRILWAGRFIHCFSLPFGLLVASLASCFLLLLEIFLVAAENVPSNGAPRPPKRYRCWKPMRAFQSQATQSLVWRVLVQRPKMGIGEIAEPGFCQDPAVDNVDPPMDLATPAPPYLTFAAAFGTDLHGLLTAQHQIKPRLSEHHNPIAHLWGNLSSPPSPCKVGGGKAAGRTAVSTGRWGLPRIGLAAAWISGSAAVDMVACAVWAVGATKLAAVINGCGSSN